MVAQVLTRHTPKMSYFQQHDEIRTTPTVCMHPTHYWEL